MPAQWFAADGAALLLRRDSDKRGNFVVAAAFSASAKAKIEAAGGSCEVTVS